MCFFIVDFGDSRQRTQVECHMLGISAGTIIAVLVFMIVASVLLTMNVSYQVMHKRSLNVKRETEREERDE